MAVLIAGNNNHNKGPDWRALSTQIHSILPYVEWHDKRDFLVNYVKIYSDGITARIEGLPEVVTVQVPRVKRAPLRLPVEAA